MADFIELAAQPRDIVGKASRRLMREGRLPAVMYGHGVPPVPVTVDLHDFELLLSHMEGLSGSLLHLNIEGHKTPVNVMIKSVQTNPVKGALQHVDFWAVRMNEAIHAVVPVHFVGEAPGVKAGGVLNHSLNDVAVVALPADIPEFIEADISALEIGQNIHVSDLKAPAKVTISTAPEEIVGSVTPPTVAPTAEESAAAEQPEVIGEAAEEE